MTVTLPLECHQPARYRNWLQVGVPVWPARSGTSPAPMELSPARCAEVSLVVIFNGSSLGDRLRAGDEGGERGGGSIMPAMKFGTHHRLRARYSCSWLIRDNESGRAHDFGESKLRGAAPPPSSRPSPTDEGGRHGATLLLLRPLPRNTFVGLIATKR